MACDPQLFGGFVGAGRPAEGVCEGVEGDEEACRPLVGCGFLGGVVVVASGGVVGGVAVAELVGEGASSR